MKVFFFILFFFATLTSHSQRVIDIDKNDIPKGSVYYVVAGVPITNGKYVKVVEGSPYFNKAWMKGRVELSEGRIYDSLILRLDLVENSVEYIGPDGREMIATTPISRVTLIDSISGKEYLFIHSSFLQTPGLVEPGWYLLLTKGRATLFSRALITVTGNQPYSSATTEQTIHSSPRYFVLTKTGFSRIKKLNDLEDLLKDKKEELNAFLSSRKLPGKSDADFIAVVAYYNSLAEK